MNILVVNQPLNNRGDEAAHKAFLNKLCESFPKSKITVLFQFSNDDSIRQFNVDRDNVAYVNIKRFKYRNYNFFVSPLYYKLYMLWFFHPQTLNVIKHIKKADFVICAPGGICMGGFQDWGHLTYLSIAKFFKKRIIYYGRSFGPFPIETKKNRRFKQISLNLLNYFSFISIRDKKTEELANLLGVKYNTTVDSAFLERPNTTLPADLAFRLTGDYLVFVPNMLVWHHIFSQYKSSEIDNFYQSIVRLCFEVYPNKKIVLLPQTFNYENDQANDVNYFRYLSNKINDNRIIVLPDTLSSDIQQKIISEADFIIGARYHSIVFSINQNRPFIALSYENKIEGLLGTLDLNDRMVDIQSIFGDKEKIQHTLAKIEVMIRNLNKSDRAQRMSKDIAETCFEKLTKYMQG